MASRAVESADAWRVSTAPPVKCVKWADTELTANQVTLMAIAACLYRPACKGRKVATSQLSGGVAGGWKCPKTSETGEQLADHREREACERLWSARGVAPFFALKPRHDCLCYAARTAATQSTESRGGWSIPGLFGLVAREQELILLCQFLYGSLMCWIRNRAASETAARLCL